MMSANVVGALALVACSGIDAPEVGEQSSALKDKKGKKPEPPQPPAPDLSASCGYEVESGTYSQWPGGYQAWVKVKNTQGAAATRFDVLIDIGDTTIQNGYEAEYERVERGYLASEPSWLKWQPIKRGQQYGFGFIGKGNFEQIKSYIISIDGQTCDAVPPEIALSIERGLVTSAGTLTLTAAATDNVAVRKVIFKRDGQVIGQDWEAPYTLDVPVDAGDNGRHKYTAIAVDPTGNTSEAGASALVAIGNRFFGGAVDEPAADFATYFNQLTPENAGKWGSVEATRDQFDWSKLDVAYQYAKAHGFPFKIHTLVWGQQQPAWLSSLSPEEQLEEIREWYAALAARYGDAELIDVVNEPLHAPPAYAAALGGAGATGWDWVIKSFELAREYFPNSELLLNDYQILILPDATQQYLGIISLLQERGLIDGIGEQGHFLERAELPVVQANLEALAATGLPIYISEFDVNFANDARQAERVRDLLTLFMAHPSVVGITQWGYEQGKTWQPNAYLVRSNGTARPALDWITCTLAGEAVCSVPEYVPAPRVGDEFGITLEAEDYDDASGVVALGNAVAYTDAGDYVGYRKVQFGENWDKLWVTYTKGGGDVGSISIHLDSLESAAVLETPLALTGGWGTSNTLELALPPIQGQHDVYVRFHGAYGVANLDSLRFGTPEPGPNLIPSGSFESGSSGWFGWSGSPAVSSDVAHSGTQSFKVGGGGVAAYNIKDVVTPGASYQAKFWVTIAGAPTADVHVTQKIVCAGQSDQYTWLPGSNKTVSEGSWIELAGTVEVPNCTLNEYLLYVEGPGVTFYVDDVSLRAPELTNLVSNGTFETSMDPWFGWGGSGRSLSTESAHGGSQSLKVGGGGVAAYDLTNAVTPGSTYQAQFWVTVASGASADVHVTQKTVCAGESDQYTWVPGSNMTVTGGTWANLSGPVAVPNCDLQQLLLYVEGPGVDYYVDDVVVSP